MQSPLLAGQDAHDDYVKQLLDQRTARADSYGRLFTPSDYSDTPSVYSHSFFSPRPQGGSESPSPVDDCPPSSHDQIPSSDGRHRLSSNGSLNLRDDLDSSYPAHHTPLHVKHEGDEDPDAEPLPRMSVLGPKMRFHSRAPWETEEDTLHEEDETLSEVDRPATNRNKPKFFNFTPTSPRISKLSRPSVESTRSEVSRKISIDKGLHLRAGFHTHSPGNSPPGKTCHSDRQDNAGQPYVRQSPSSTSPSSSNTPSPIRRLFNPANFAKINHSPFDPDNHRDSTGDNTRISLGDPTPSELPHSVHPYANPDLVAYPEQDEQPEPPLPAVDIVSSNSTSTVTASSTASSVSEAATSPLTPDTSTASVPSRKAPTPTKNGRQISTPVAVISHSMQDKNQPLDSLPLFPGVQNLHGWTGKANTPGFSLISLEEARAQRARTAGQMALPNKSSNTSLDEDALSSRPEPANMIQDVQSPYKTSIIQRTRARSISASAKAKSALHSVVGTQIKHDNHESESINGSQGKSLKHKKSGIMRLLIGSKTQDQDERSQPPPPVPVLPEMFSPHNHQQNGQKKLHRVPVPELTGEEIASPHDKPGVGDRSRWLSRTAHPSKPIPPPLSITPVALQSTSPRAQSVVVDSLERPWMSTGAPLSAPAHVTNFPALQLRPVSTLFGAQFAEHLVKGPSLELDINTPRASSSNMLATPPPFESPIGPQDQSAEMRALQQNMVSAKLAWQRQIWELEGQIRDLKAEMEGLKREDYCEACGRGEPHSETKASVVNRPRARTATSARFGNSLT